MCKTRRELAQEQLDLMNHIRTYANINMVTCGHCGTILLHDSNREFDKDPLVCFGCKTENTDASNCPDYWYDGCIESSAFDEDEPKKEPTKEITIDDVATIAMDLKINASIAEMEEVLKYYDSEVEQDPTATWDLIVENLLYNCVAPSGIK